MRVRFLLIALLALLAVPAYAAPVRTVSLGRDVDVWYLVNDTLPIVDVLISVEGAGTASDPDGKEGRAMFAAALLGEGAGELDALAFAQALEEKAITLDFSASQDRLTIHVRALREYAGAAGNLLALALSIPRLGQEDAARVRNMMLTQLALLEEDPAYLAERAFDTKAFAGHPYAKPAYGTVTSVSKLAAEDAKTYLKEHLSRARLTITAAGDVDDALLEVMLKPVLAAMPGAPVVAPVAKVTMQGAGESLHMPRALPQSAILFAAPAIERSDKRFYAAYLLNQAMGGNGLVSRFADVLRQRKGLVYGIDTGLEVSRGGVILKGMLATATATAEEAKTAVMETLKNLQEKGLTAQECAEARSYVLGAFPLDLDGTGKQAGVLMSMRLYDLGKDYLEKRQEYFNEVTCGDVNALARELLAPERFVFVTVGEAPKEQP